MRLRSENRLVTALEKWLPEEAGDSPVDTHDIALFKTIRNRLQSDSKNAETRYKEDHVFMYPVPFTREEVLLKTPTKPLTLGVTPEYNFYHKKYEAEARRTGVWLAVLPNLLTTIIERTGRDSDSRTFSEKAIPENLKEFQDVMEPLINIHHDFVTLNGKIKSVFKDAFLTEEKKIKTGERDTVNYFTAWTDAARRASWDDKSALAKLYKNQILLPKAWSNGTTSFPSEIARLKKMFPMMVDLCFTPIVQHPGNNSLINILTSPPEGAPPMWYAFLKLFMDGRWNRNVSVVSVPSSSEKTKGFSNPAVQEYDFYTFLEKLDPWALEHPKGGMGIIDSEGLPYLHGSDAVPAQLMIPASEDPQLWSAVSIMKPPRTGSDIHSAAKGTTLKNQSYAPFVDALEFSMEDFRKRFRQLVKEKTRVYSQILQGHTAHFEVLYWKVSKYFATKDGKAKGNALQNFYYLNLPDTKEINLLDTQVVYDKPFVYKIDAIVAVFGTEYEYLPLKERVKTQFSRVTKGDFDKYYKGFIKPPKELAGGQLAKAAEAADLLENIGLESTVFAPIWDTTGGPGGQVKIYPDNDVYWPDDPKFVDPNTGWSREGPTGSPMFVMNWGTEFFEGKDATGYPSKPITKKFGEFLRARTTADDNIYTDEFASTKPKTPVEILRGIGRHRSLSNTNKDVYVLDFDVISRPSVKIMEIPHAEISTVVLDSPPLPPIVRFTPFRGINNKYLLSFSAGTGIMEGVEPIALLPEDAQKIERQIVAQRAGFPPVLTYETDDPPEYFEIFRLDPPDVESEILANQALQYYPPTSYESFKNNSFYKKIFTRGAMNSTAIEEIEPNKKYYYTFRTKDIHENISNPSSVYEVKLVDDGGAVYLLVDAYEFPRPKRTNTKDMRQYVSIIPTLEQTIINKAKGSTDKAVSNYNLGIAEDSIFDTDKTFKIRLTSKQTGKKVDFNINFDNTQYKK